MISLNPDSLTERAIRARCMELDRTLDNLFDVWMKDQASAAVDRAPLTEGTVQAAEARARKAVADREAAAVLAAQAAERAKQIEEANAAAQAQASGS